MSDLSELVSNRGNIKGALTRLHKFVQSEEFDSCVLTELKTKRERLIDAFRKYESVNMTISHLNPQDSENVGDYEDKYDKTLSRLNDQIQRLEPSVKESSSSPPTVKSEKAPEVPPLVTKNIKLPSIEIPTFKGKYSEYHQFINMYNSVIHNNPSLDNIQKLYYLRNFVKDEPFDLIKNLPMCNESYEEAITILNDRYDNKSLIQADHISQLLDLPSVRSSSASLRDFIASVRQHSAALKNLDCKVESWDPLLIAIFSRKLDQFTTRAFTMERKERTPPTMKEFLDFLERRALALESAPPMTATGTQQQKKYAVNMTTEPASAATCSFCKSSHRLYLCPKFKLIPVKERTAFVKEKRLCKICLNLHTARCKYHFRCNTCKGDHNTLLHTSDEASVVLLSKNPVVQTLLPTVKVSVKGADGTSLTLRALLDSGSQVSFINEKIVQKLGLKPMQTNTNIIGITNTSSQVKYSLPIEVCSLVSSFKITVNCNVIDKITCELPQIEVKPFEIPPGFKLADDTYNTPGEIDMLMGCNVFFQVILPPLQPSNNAAAPRLLNTQFGHVVGGVLPSQEFVSKHQVSLLCSTCNSNVDKIVKCFWETEKVPAIFNENNTESELCKQIFDTTTILKNDHYQVDLPLKVPLDQVNEHLGDSFNLALGRFINLEKKLQKNPTLFEQYKDFINQIIDLGHGHFVDIQNYDLQHDAIYFIPHHAVFNEHSKTTKLRVVFDGSMKTSKKVALNDLLLNGPVVQNDLCDIMLLFRFGQHMFATDIKKMFRCIKLNPLHASLQMILWRENPSDEIKCIQLDTVTYGLKSSSFLATQCLNDLAVKYEKDYPLAAQILQTSTFVDDILYADNDFPRILEAQRQITDLLKLGGFETHKWSSNVTDILQAVPTQDRHFDEIDFREENFNLKTLGLNFNVKDDCFTINCPEDFNNSITKREILSYTAKFYDPLGFVSPIIVTAKHFIQGLWSAKLDWDSPLPRDLADEWFSFTKDLAAMPTINLKRNIAMHDAVSIQLIGFADASSSTAYGCAIYARVVHNDNQVRMHLLCSKSRLNPLDNRLTVPRLELNAALLLAKLMTKVYRALSTKLCVSGTYLFSDSQIVLAWTQTEITRLNAYVANRVKMIKELTSSWSWHYVGTKDNPADCITRGVKPQELANLDLWWNGPCFLRHSEYEFSTVLDLPNELPEMKPCLPPQPGAHVGALSGVVSLPLLHGELDIFKKYSDIQKLKRIIAYILRFFNNCKTKREERIKCNYLSASELNNALLTIIRHEQHVHLSDELQALKNGSKLTGSLKPLHPFIDSTGIIRVGGRLQNSELPYSQKHQVILPKTSQITNMIISSEHIRLLHAGPKLLLSSLNQKFWIVNGLRVVKKIIHKCTTCFRLKAENSKQLMGSLPADRVTQARPFQRVGVDFAGPVEVKQSRVRRAVVSKGYICIFVCFTTKAVHIELTSDLTTASFLACFKRFVSRRGLPTDVYSDNASTFKGARNQLADLYKLHSSPQHQREVTNHAALHGVNFHFIPSYSPVFGGLWEAAVKSTKYHLKRIIGKCLLTYEELSTVLTQIEGILNSRPLLPLSSNCDDFAYLTPGHFLTGTALVTYPEHDLTETPISRLRLWNVVNNMTQSFWKVWHKQYLNILQSRPKWRDELPNVQVGDLVLLREDNCPPMSWPMARITKIFPGKDNMVRAFEVMTSNRKTHLRSVTKICLFPIHDK